MCMNSIGPWKILLLYIFTERYIVKINYIGHYFCFEYTKSSNIITSRRAQWNIIQPIRFNTTGNYYIETYGFYNWIIDS